MFLDITILIQYDRSNVVVLLQRIKLALDSAQVDMQNTIK